MALGRCPLSIFCSRGTPPRDPESITYGGPQASYTKAGLGSPVAYRMQYRRLTTLLRGRFAFIQCNVNAPPVACNSVSLGLAGYSKVDTLGVWYTSVNFGARDAPPASSKVSSGMVGGSCDMDCRRLVKG